MPLPGAPVGLAGAQQRYRRRASQSGGSGTHRPLERHRERDLPRPCSSASLRSGCSRCRGCTRASASPLHPVPLPLVRGLPLPLVLQVQRLERPAARYSEVAVPLPLVLLVPLPPERLRGQGSPSWPSSAQARTCLRGGSLPLVLPVPQAQPQLQVPQARLPSFVPYVLLGSTWLSCSSFFAWA